MPKLDPKTCRALTLLASATDDLSVARSRRTLRRAQRSCRELSQLIEALTERASRVIELERLAGQDPLTGLANRRTFRIALEREIARRRRGRGLTVVLLDLDGLKEINDSYGHEAGDQAILATAQECLAGTRASDLVARLGGDEFAILLPDTDGPGAIAVAERIRERIEVRQVHGVGLRVSYGIAVAGPDGEDGAALLANADARMYEDKFERRSPQRLAA